MLRHSVPSAGAYLLLAVAGFAADFAAVNISPDPDTLVRFDTANPAGAGPVLATLVGNFVRGLDLTGPGTGWYVATSSIGPSPTGFYRLTAGLSTLVAPLPFLSSGESGLTLSRHEDHLWQVIDPPGTQEDTLYRVTFDGTFTQVAQIALPGVPNPLIDAVALDHATGVLYGIESSTDSLIQIDTGTGNAVRVGTGLGVSVSGVVGADFAADGSGVIYLSVAASVYPVDPVTGLAGARLGTLPFSSSSIAGIPGPINLDVTSLRVGQPFTTTLSGGQNGDVWATWLSAAPIYLPTGPLGVLRIDLSAGFPYGTGVLDPTGQVSVPFAVPPAPALAGITIWFQGYAVRTTPSFGGGLTNVIGRTIAP
jgi:hypothetical protein